MHPDLDRPKILSMTYLMTLALFAGLSSAGFARAESAAELSARLQKFPNNLKLREQTATAYAGENQSAKVIELLNPYTDQLSAQGFFLLASSYSNGKDYANEVRVLKIVAGQNDENYQWHMLLGQAFLKEASITKSIETNRELITGGILELRRALQLNKKFKPAYDALLVTLLQQKNNNEARELLVEGIEKFGDRPELYRELCRLDALDGFLVQAVQHCRISINLSPGFPDHYVYLTQALQDQKEDARAEKEIVEAGRRFPASEFVQWAAGTMFMAKKNYPVAARYFEAAVKAQPTQGRSQFGLAQALFSSGRQDQALPHYKEACRMVPGALDTFLASGSRLKQEGKVDLGTRYLSAAGNCQLAPSRGIASDAPTPEGPR